MKHVDLSCLLTMCFVCVVNLFCSCCAEWLYVIVFCLCCKFVLFVVC